MNAPEATVEEVVAAMWWLSAVCLAMPACAFLSFVLVVRSFVRGSFVRSPAAQAFQA